LGTTLTNQNDIHDEIKSRLNWREYLLSFSPKSFVSLLISKSQKSNISLM
jgi:hypothetical protein